MISKKIIAAALAAALSVSAAAAVIVSVGRSDYGYGLLTDNDSNTIVVDSDICALMGIDSVNTFSPDTLSVKHNSGTSFDTIDITTPPEYDDSVKTALVLKPDADISNVDKSDIIGISQDMEISQIILPHLDGKDNAGTYTVLMGGTKGNIYSGSFTIESAEPQQPAPVASSEPVTAPTDTPAATPAVSPALEATTAPTSQATSKPDVEPTIAPSTVPTAIPTPDPTGYPMPTPHDIPPPDDERILLSYEDGKAYISSWFSLDAVVVFAEYGDDNTLVSLEITPVNVADRTTVVVARNKSVSEDNKLKIMLWDNVESMTPMCKAYSNR